MALPLGLLRPSAVGAIFGALIIGCAEEAPPPPLTDEEVAALGITQGLAGRAVLRDGSCMPGCSPEPCHLERVPLTLHVLPGDPAIVVPQDSPESCMIDIGETKLPGFKVSEPALADSIAALDLSKDDVFSIQLDPGTYQLLLVDEAGCAFCWGTEIDGGIATCNRIHVEAESVTRKYIYINAAAE